jgi:hypothetical protein
VLLAIAAIVALVAVWSRSRRQVEGTGSAPRIESKDVPDVRPDTRRYSSRPPSLLKNDQADTSHKGSEQRAAANSILAVVEAELTDRTEERELLLVALLESGPAVGAWVPEGRSRLDDVRRYIAQLDLGMVQDLGCWASGCGARIEFNSADSTRRLEKLADPWNRGGWHSGVVITEPTEVDGRTLVSHIFFVAPTQ